MRGFWTAGLKRFRSACTGICDAGRAGKLTMKKSMAVTLYLCAFLLLLAVSCDTSIPFCRTTLVILFTGDTLGEIEPCG